MRTIFITILIFLDVALFGQGFTVSPYVIPSGGAVVELCNGDSTCSPVSIFVGTGKSVVNLGSNSYSLQTNGTPPSGTSFICRFDATQLTAVSANVNIFGLTPLKDFPGQGIYYILYQVSGTRNYNKTVFVSYTGSMIQPGGNVNTLTKFNNEVTFYDSVHLHVSNPILTGSGVVAINDSGTLGYGCAPWCTSGNGGLNRTNYLGTSDTVALRFRVNSLPAGIIDYNKFNTAFGVYSMASNTTGGNNVAIGAQSLFNNTTGNNTAVGCFSSGSITTGSGNTAIGRSSLLSAPTTGSNNTAVGGNAAVSSAATTGATAIGYNTTASDNGVALGFGITASANQFAVGGENEYHPNMNSGLNYVMTDTCGCGVFVPMPIGVVGGGTFTPVTGDSLVINKQINTINPAGTLTNLTIVFPSTAKPFQLIYFNFQQIITNLHYSVRISGGANPTQLPSSETVGGTFSAYFDPNLNTWIVGSH